MKDEHVHKVSEYLLRKPVHLTSRRFKKTYKTCLRYHATHWSINMLDFLLFFFFGF
uniref:Uncharacterized protein n=1 Tax=Anguilla anguilla TaxID=7936 RepID=A0A0E9W7N6_ANGAN